MLSSPKGKQGKEKSSCLQKGKRKEESQQVYFFFFLTCHGTLILSSFLKIKFGLLKHFSPSENFNPNLKRQTKLDWVEQNGKVIKLQQ